MRQAVVLLAVICLLAVPAFAEAVSGEVFTMTFSTNEDYDTSAYASASGLREVEEDFKLVKALGLDKLRVSFSWSNYEPMRGRFANLEWLHQFVDLAEAYEIELMPYFCYAPSWATPFGGWNEPPADLDDWYNYIYRMVSEFKDQIDVWEIWNEEDMSMWFTGSPAEFAQVLETGARAVRDADPDAIVLMGGITAPDEKYVEFMLDQGLSSAFDVVPVHSYHESWSSATVESYLTSWGSPFNDIKQLLLAKGDGQEVWVNEIGYPTIGGRTEEDQASFIRRAVATLMSTEAVTLISWYEIKDLPQDFHLGVIGDDNNYHLGLTRVDRTPKLGFHTYQNIVELLNYEPVRYLGDAVRIEEIAPGRNPQRIYAHGFHRQNHDDIVLFVWLYGPKSVVDITLTLPGVIAEMVEYDYDGTAHDASGFVGSSINLELRQDHARLFKVKLVD
ncbi:MAG: family 1 glycosylhydrolase [Firmicutes bacterium]|nr:family 1 glycosylhydrolase [Bacillota bacterium]